MYLSAQTTALSILPALFSFFGLKSKWLLKPLFSISEASLFQNLVLLVGGKTYSIIYIQVGPPTEIK